MIQGKELVCKFLEPPTRSVTFRKAIAYNNNDVKLCFILEMGESSTRLFIKANRATVIVDPFSQNRIIY